MIGSLMKRLQKTVSGEKPLDSDTLDNLAAESLSGLNLNSVETAPAAPLPEEKPKPEVKAEAPAQKPLPAPEPEKPAPKPVAPKPSTAPKKETVIEVKRQDIAFALLAAEAKKWLKVRESGGSNKGPEVERFQKAVDGQASGEPWCLAFVWFCLLETAKAYKARFSEELPLWLFRTEHCLTMWNLSPKEARLNQPEPGAVIIWQHLSPAGQPTSRGHVGIILRVLDKSFVETIEGNTANDSTVEDEGDGVYMLKRNYKQATGSKRVIGFLRPWKEI